MNDQQLEVYRRVQQFSFDEPDAVFPFSQRLARDNGWTIQYTQRVIDEYKKFLVLAAIAGHPVTPSEQVDQVWHLHLTYTHSYWDQLCAETLQKPLHHHPTRGGSGEYKKFYKWYSETLISYEKFFNQSPPSDIWAPPVVRLSQGKDFVRINTKAYWLVPKPSFQFPKTILSSPKLPLAKLSAIALIFFLAALALYSIVSAIAPASAYSNHFSEAQIIAAQVITKNPAPSHGSIFQDWRTKAFFAISGLFFLFSIAQFIYYKIFINKPVFISPVGSSEFQSRYNSHDREAGVVHFFISFTFWNGFIALAAPSLLFLKSNLLVSLFLILLMGVLIYYLCFYAFFIWKVIRRKPTEKLFSNGEYTISNKHLIQLIRDNGSIRPLRCNSCKQPLRELSREITLENLELSKSKIVAARMNGISFQIWHCSRCHSKINRGTVHLYTLKPYTYMHRGTAHCPICKEQTIRITQRVMKSATIDEEGEGMTIRTCECCGRKDEEAHTIPKISPPPPELPSGEWGCGACI